MRAVSPFHCQVQAVQINLLPKHAWSKSLKSCRCLRCSVTFTSSLPRVYPSLARGGITPNGMRCASVPTTMPLSLQHGGMTRDDETSQHHDSRSYRNNHRTGACVCSSSSCRSDLARSILDIPRREHPAHDWRSRPITITGPDSTHDPLESFEALKIPMATVGMEVV
ncbi:hypothetical protein BJX70DRAFT_44405 [Aspergillus crustosus]